MKNAIFYVLIFLKTQVSQVRNGIHGDLYDVSSDIFGQVFDGAETRHSYF